MRCASLFRVDFQDADGGPGAVGVLSASGKDKDAGVAQMFEVGPVQAERLFVLGAQLSRLAAFAGSTACIR